MVVDPLQGGVGEDEVEPLAEPRLDVPLGEGQPGTSPCVGSGACQHRLGGVDAHGLGRLHALVQLRREVAGPATEVDHPPAGNRDAQGDQIVEGLPSFGEESLVLVRVPPLNRSHGHRLYV